MVHWGPEHCIWVTLAYLALVDGPCIILKPLENPGKSRSLRPRSLDNLDFIQLPVVSRGPQAGGRKWYKVKMGKLINSHEVIVTQGEPTNDQGMVFCLAGLIFSCRVNYIWEFRLTFPSSQ